MKSALLASGIGVSASTALFGLALLIGGPIVAWLMLSGTPIATILSWLLPDRFFYWYAPEGGADAAVPLFALSAWFQWAVLFGAIAFLLLRKGRAK